MPHLRPAPDAPDPTASAVIVPVPAAEPLVGAHRDRLDPSSRYGVPAHVTVLFPFVEPAGLSGDVIARLGAVVAGVGAFRCRFGATAWFGDEVLWLAPQPAASFRDLTERVWAAFDDHPPYGGAYDEVTPHLTVGQTRGTGTTVEDLRAAEAEVTAGLPLTVDVTRALLVAGTSSADSWRTVAALPLAR